jgi:hypothetical protein
VTPRYVVNRRRFLKSLGMAVPAVALPILRSSPSLAAPTFPRLAVLWYPNGTILDMFWPSGPGANYTVPSGGILEPLMPFRAKLNVLKGLNANSTDAGPGSAHQKGAVAALTGGHAMAGNMNGGNNSPSGFADRISLDQYIASKWDGMTPLKTLNAGVKMNGTGNRHAISYLGPNQPVFPTDDPAKLYALTFGSFVKPTGGGGASDTPDPAVLNLLGERKSVLDFASSDLNRLSARLPGEERMRLQRHLDSLRDLERKIAPRSGGGGAGCSPEAPATIDPKADANYPMVTRLQMDIMFNAMACDQTRLPHLMWSGETSVQTFPWLGINNAHHDMSHQDGNKDTAAKLVKVGRWYAEQVAYFLGKLDGVMESNGKTMLDNSLVIWANGLGRGSNHTRKDTPYVLAGSAGGYFTTGKFFQFSNNHNDLMVSVLHAMGLRDEKTFGDPKFCTGPLPGLTA